MTTCDVLNILLVEDDGHDAIAIRRTLERAENAAFRLTVFDRAEDALAALLAENLSCNIVIFDFNLPGENGLEAAERLLKLKPNLPVVLLTGEGSEEVAVHAMRAGFADYIVKDVSAGYLKLLPAKLEDVFKRCRQAREHREVQKRYSRLVELSPDIFYTFSSTRGFLFASRRFEEIFGYSVEQLAKNSQLWRSRVHEQDLESIVAAMNGAVAGSHFNLEYRTQAANGEWKWLRDRSIGISEDTSEILISGIASDITKEKDLAYLRENFEMITRHDLRSPLSGIIGLSNLLVEDVEGPSQEFAVAIAGAANSMLDMLNRWMALYKLEAGLFESTPTRVVLEELFQAVMIPLLHTPDFQGRTIRCTPCSASIVTDNVLLSAIVTNLLKNALEAGTKDDPVDLTCRDEGDILSIEVRNAQEVPADIKPYFFEKFYSRGKRSGTGLGNFSAKLMTEALGGSISMVSSKEDGTTVRVMLNKKMATDT